MKYLLKVIDKKEEDDEKKVMYATIQEDDVILQSWEALATPFTKEELDILEPKIRSVKQEEDYIIERIAYEKPRAKGKI